eukprot:scaffold72554_cov66-Phaeocystis_antarctica.AAC.2
MSRKPGIGRIGRVPAFSSAATRVVVFLLLLFRQRGARESTLPMTWRTHKLQAQNQYDPSGLASPRGITPRVFMTPPHQSWDATSNYPVTDISVDYTAASQREQRCHSRCQPVRRIPCATSTRHGCASVHRCAAQRCLHACSRKQRSSPWALAPRSLRTSLGRTGPGELVSHHTLVLCASTLTHAHTRLGLGLGLGLALLGHEAARLEHASDPAPPPCPCAGTVSAQ